MSVALFSSRLLLGAAFVFGTGASMSDPATHPHSKPAVGHAARVVTVIARDYAFEAPDTILAGRTQLRLVNRGSELHHAYLLRLDSGKGLDDLLASLRSGGPLPAWTHDAGGPNAPAPGATSSAVLDIAPGTYAIICVIPSADGTPHVMKGMAHTFTVVSGSDSRAATPVVKVGTPDVTVDLSDYTFALTRPLSRGHHVIRVRNTAAQSHEMFVARLAPGKNAGDALAWIESPKGPPPLMPLGGTVGLAHGASNDIAMDFTPGDYALFCFIPDAKDGKPHVAHGMIKSFTVR
jgi:uncharacterized cupredoxin-like copper-binding protein